MEIIEYITLMYSFHFEDILQYGWITERAQAQGPKGSGACTASVWSDY